MPDETKKRKKKSGKKSSSSNKGDLAIIRAEAEQRQRLLEEKEAARRREEVEREANLLKRESEIERRELECKKIEEETRSRLEKMDAEISARSRSAVASAEQRASDMEARCAQHEKELTAREQKLVEAESEYRVLKIEIEAREQAMSEEFTGGVAKKLNKILVDQAENRDVLQARERALDKRQLELQTQELAFKAKVTETEKNLAQQQEKIHENTKIAEENIAKQEFAARQRARRRLAESEAILMSHRSECQVRDRKLKAREEEIARRNRELHQLSRKIRKQDSIVQQQFKNLTGQTEEEFLQVAQEERKNDPTSMGSPLTGFYRPTTAPYAPGCEVPLAASDQGFHINTLLNRIDSIKAEIVQEVRTPYAARRLPPSSRNRPKSAAKYGKRSKNINTARPHTASARGRHLEGPIITIPTDCLPAPDLTNNAEPYDNDSLF